MKAKIKVGWPVGQDFSFFRWPAEHADVVFDVKPMSKDTWGGRLCCRAQGFGILPNPSGSNENYGNGAVYADIKCLDIVDLEGVSLRFTNHQRTLIFDAGA